jgi:hypothetical protein
LAQRIDIEPTTLGERGPRYRVTHGGALLIESARNPELDACRKLRSLGLAGRLEVWRKGKPHPDMVIADIERGAQLTVNEGDRYALRFAAWQAREALSDSVSCSSARPPAADFIGEVGRGPADKTAVLESPAPVLAGASAASN